MTKLESTFHLALLVILAGASRADTPVYDPTDPSQVVEESSEEITDGGLLAHRSIRRVSMIATGTDRA